MIENYGINIIFILQDVFSGKYGDLWKKYMKENQPERYYHLVNGNVAALGTSQGISRGSDFSRYYLLLSLNIDAQIFVR